MRSLLHVVLGAALALALVLSCSDDSPSDVDAATNCEPPLDGRITTLENVQSSATGIVAIAICPAGGIRLGGGCEIQTQGASSLRLNQAGARNDLPGNYACVWDNPDMSQVTVKAWVTGLVPAS